MNKKWLCFPQAHPTPMALFLFLLLHLKSDPQLQAVSAPPNQFTRRVWLGANDWPVRDDTHRPEAQELNIEKLRWQFSPVTGGQLGRLTGLFHKWIPGQPKYDSCLTPAQGDKPRWKRKWVQPSLNLLLKRRNRESKCIWLDFELQLYCASKTVFFLEGGGGQIRGHTSKEKKTDY